MKFKWWFIPIALVILFILCRITSILQFYTVPTSSNEPTIAKGGWIFSTNLRKPKLLDFICYRQAAGPGWPAGIWVKRLCGLPGDKVQLINGVLYVNDRIADSGLNLKNVYTIPVAELEKLGPDFLNDRADIQQAGKDSVEAALETSMIQTHSIKGHLFIDTSTEGIQSRFGQHWTRDNFGPLRIPEGQYFLLGDNRHSSADSRFAGLTPTANVLGTVFAILK
jgi:signal peptidase I